MPGGRYGRLENVSAIVPAPAPTMDAITTVAKQVNVACRDPPIASVIAIAVIGSR